MSSQLELRMNDQKQYRMQDEQRVVIWLALRDMHRDPSARGLVRVADVEEECWAFWSGAGVYRSKDTWVRAFRRAKNCPERLLGKVRESKEKGARWSWYRYSKNPDELLAGIGPVFQGIAHGKRKSTAARAA